MPRLPRRFVLVVTLFLIPSALGGDGVRERHEQGVLANFLIWAEGYLDGGARTRGEMLSGGQALAEARLPLLRVLMEQDPEAAQEVAVSLEEWEQFPPEIRKHLERPFSADGWLRVLAVDDFERGSARYEWRLKTRLKTYRVFPAMPEADIPINRPVRVVGFRIGSSAVVSEVNPL